MAGPGSRGGFSTTVRVKNQYEFPVRGDRASLSVQVRRGYNTAVEGCQSPDGSDDDEPMTDLRNLDRGAGRLR